MSELERRALLGAAGIGAIAALAKAGPLDPPAGAVAPTGRTLDEVYNRIPTLGGADGRIPVTASGTIAGPGSYVLAANLELPSPSVHTLNIAASNVTLDLNGFRIGNTVGAYCIMIQGAQSNITIRNGSLAGGAGGIVTDQAGIRGLLIEDLRITGTKFGGISIAATSTRDCVIRRCQINDCGVSTTPSDANAVVIGIAYNGSAGRIEDCSIHTLANNGNSPITRGILLNTANSTGNLIARCHLGNAASVLGVGILVVGGGAVYRDNVVTGYATNYNGGVNGGGNF